MSDKLKIKTDKRNCRKLRRLDRLEYIQSFKRNRCCEICGESRYICLDFHHKNKAKKEFNVSVGVHNDYSMDKIKKEMTKCMVVCANCHRVLHADDLGQNTKREISADDILPLFKISTQIKDLC